MFDSSIMRFNVTAVSGSVEQLALATNVLRKCKELSLPMLEIEVCTVESIPLLNVDLFQGAFPKPIEELREKVAKSDAVLFAAPEFFGKVSPAMKNAYDWLSYSPDLQHPSMLRNMPAALISLGGQEDGSASQKHFQQMGQFCRLKIMSKPNLHFCTANKQLYGKKLELREEDAQELRSFLQYFSDFIGKKRKNQ